MEREKRIFHQMMKNGYYPDDYITIVAIYIKYDKQNRRIDNHDTIVSIF